jgi:Predicted endonuclease containing a URI domain
MQGGRVYIMTNRPNGTLYVGVTSDLARRAWEHKEGGADGFTKRYGLKRLVYYERVRGYPNRHPAREKPQTLAEGMEGEADPGRQP